MGRAKQGHLENSSPDLKKIWPNSHIPWEVQIKPIWRNKFWLFVFKL
jgi:hypothetical protein